MTKSRMALLALSALAAAWPGATFAQIPAASAEQLIAAYDEWYEEVTDGAGRSAVRRCRRDPGEDEIVVCGRSDDSRMRIPYAPAPGARIRLIAGEPPSGMGALNAGASPRGAGIDMIALVNALDRGLDRILHPD